MALARDYLIILVLVGLGITGMLTFQSALFSTYGVQPEGPYNATLTNISNLIDDTRIFAGSVTEKGETGTKEEVVGGFTLFTALDILSFPFTVLKTITTLINDVGRDLGVPSFILVAIVSLILITFAFIIAGIMFRSKT